MWLSNVDSNQARLTFNGELQGLRLEVGSHTLSNSGEPILGSVGDAIVPPTALCSRAD